MPQVNEHSWFLESISILFFLFYFSILLAYLCIPFFHFFYSHSFFFYKHVLLS